MMFSPSLGPNLEYRTLQLSTRIIPNRLKQWPNNAIVHLCILHFRIKSFAFSRSFAGQKTHFISGLTAHSIYTKHTRRPPATLPIVIRIQKFYFTLFNNKNLTFKLTEMEWLRISLILELNAYDAKWHRDIVLIHWKYIYPMPFYTLSIDLCVGISDSI